MKIYTITLNPAYDVHAYMPHFAPFHENLAQITSRDAGGKGVNLSRALTSGGAENTAVVVLGKENAAEFKASLAEFGQTCLYFEKEGRIRENLTLHCDDSPETRISFSGFSVDDSILDEILSAMVVDSDTLVTFTGRVSGGISMTAVKDFLTKLRQKGAKIVLDSKSFSLADIYEVQPWLIKPNQEEISEYFDCEVETIAQALEKAKVFAQHGVTNAMISLGEQGALLVSDGLAITAKALAIQAVSTVGAGDSFGATFLASFFVHGDIDRALRRAALVSAFVVSRQGAVPEDLPEFLTRLP
jgi:1-phosphofructokinase family hexose kinase